MKRIMLPMCLIAYWLALALWVSSLVAAGVAAAGVFSILPGAGVTVDRFADYDHAEHGRLVAGMVMEPIFTAVDIGQAAFAAVVLATLLAQLTVFGMKWRRPANLVRALCIAAATGCFVFRVVTITPEMNRELVAYRAAAERSELVAAKEHRARFDVLHPTASRLFNLTLVLLLVGVGASALAGPSSPAPAVELQRPRLLKHP